MDRKVIRAALVKQLQDQYPHFSKLKRREKRIITQEACKAMEKALKEEEFSIPQVSSMERLGLEELPKGVIAIDEMGALIDRFEHSILPFMTRSHSRYIQDPLLKSIDELINDEVINHLLASPGMTMTKRDWTPAQLLRMELLRTIRFSGMSVRVFCAYIGSLLRKEERAFAHLSLHKNGTPDHSTLSVFRNSLTFKMRLNIMSYMLHYFFKSGILGEKVLHAIDSTEIAAMVNPAPLAKLKIGGKEIRLYANLHCDCGSRRNKRDKSDMVVGYRVHSLSVVDTEREIAYPLVSLMTAANHHDSQLLGPVLDVAKLLGLKIQVVSADEAYADAEKAENMRKDEGIVLITPPKEKATTPVSVDEDTGHVFCHDACETPMSWCGHDEENGNHLYKCGNEGTCPFFARCIKEREIEVDTKLFGSVPQEIAGVKQAQDIRKTAERPFNTLKHMDGLERCKFKNTQGVQAQVLFSHMVGLFKVMAGLRSKPKEVPIKKPQQLELFAEAS